MIIGKGLIATSLQNIDSENIIFFASGVSNSLETRTSEFEREFSLLQNSIENNKEHQIIYFSTLSVNDQSKQDSPYVIHKLNIENFIKNNCKKYLIVRVGNVVGKGGNPNTLFNFLREQINNESSFVLHNKATRILIDIDDISEFLSHHSSTLTNQTINLSFPYNYSLKEIISSIEEDIEKKAVYKETELGDSYKVDFSDHTKVFFSKFSSDEYLKKLIQKYY
ncbi:hypothetical protein OF897_00125 [Chryseobacterium formosus]|uniref:NAD-dependent epimerase/dehydratase domain-containing protein n=1 Tax=Chryseobacterium formosus TaxID=1537363 RepID=A0ABT3XMF1_9FLAO|nr:hypothetical protein [Chryseobacterium formosus]MCX8522327.1 hypothetical protein [Chryseobacterium formosus]